MDGANEIRLEIGLGQLRMIAWALLGVGLAVLLVGLSRGNHGLLITGCFLGISARILQAEAHFLLESKRPPRGP